MKNAKWILILLLLNIILTGCTLNQSKSYKAKNGTIDLGQWNLNTDENVSLSGEWELYGDKLFTYSDFKNNQSEKPLLVEVPKPWTDYGEKGLKSQGVGTYRLHVKTKLPSNSLMSLRVYTFSSAYKMFINDKEVASNGTVGYKKEEYKPEYKPLTTVFNIPNSEFDIIIQVANFDFYRGGFWYDIHMGSVDSIRKYQNYLIGKELFIVGSFFVVALFYLSISILNQNAKIYLYFGIMAVLAIIVFDVLGELLICSIFPDMPFNILIRIWYTAIQLLIFMLIVYVGELFPTKYNKKFIYLFGIVTAIITGLYIFTPVIFYTRFAKLLDGITILAVGYSIVLAVIGYKKKMEGALLYIIGIIIVFMTIFHDIFYRHNYINSYFGEITFIGEFIILLINVFIHARKTANENEEKIRLIMEVESSKRAAIISERNFLQAQIKPHFLFNALSVIASLSIRNPGKTRSLVISLGEYLRNSFDFDSSDDMVPIHKELELIEAYMEIEKARYRDRISFEVDWDDSIDVKIPRFVIQPLVENAIRHGILKNPHGGVVTVNIRSESDFVKIEVTDNGKGIPQDVMNKILNDSKEIRGVGIKNINKRLKSLYGKGINISSEIDKYTKVSFEVPITQRDVNLNKNLMGM